MTDSLPSAGTPTHREDGAVIRGFAGWASGIGSRHPCLPLRDVVYDVMRCVLDTDVIVAALRSSSGASRQLLIAVDEGRLDLVISVPLVLEWEAVLKRWENFLAAGIDLPDVDSVINRLVERAMHAEPHFLWRPQAYDPNDEIVLETAVNGVADTIVSSNTRDLLLPAKRFASRSSNRPRY
jgi:putative PIN family toxin of toxin-antitoxin system